MIFANFDQLKAKVSGTSKPEDAALEVAKELGIPLKDGYNGKLTSDEAGKVGGRIGGSCSDLIEFKFSAFHQCSESVMIFRFYFKEYQKHMA